MIMLCPKIANQDGWIQEYEDGVSFDYVKDGKIMEVFAPDEKDLKSLIESSEKIRLF